jgi:hypothetical protein
MGKYLDIVRQVEQASAYDKNDINDKTRTVTCGGRAVHNPQCDFDRLSRFGRSFRELERRCPDLIDCADWQQAIECGRHFLARWGEQAEGLGWTSRDLRFQRRIPSRQTVGTASNDSNQAALCQRVS